jgi:hypothetical protein
MHLSDTSRHRNDPRSYASLPLRAVVVLGVTVFGVAIYLLARATIGGPAGWREAIPMVALFTALWALHELRLLSPSSNHRWVYWAEVTRDGVTAGGREVLAIANPLEDPVRLAIYRAKR